MEYYNILDLCNREEGIPDEVFVKRTNFYDWQNYTDFIESTAQSCESMVVKCKFGGKIVKCSNIFVPVLSDEGYCCAFNIVHSKFMFTREARTRINNTRWVNSLAVDWTTENGYPPNLPLNYYPHPAQGPGESLGFTIVLDADIDDYFCSSTNVAGFKILLHNPTETPQIKELGLILETGHESKFRISTDKIDASPEIRGIKPELRQCLFTQEGNLLYFRTYSKRNCEMECEAARYIEQCKCIMHYMPRIYSNATLCNLHDFRCIDQITSFSETQRSCAEMCLPGCFDLTFLPVAFSAPIDHSNHFMVSEKSLSKYKNEYTSKNLAIVHFYYKDNSFRSYMQSQYIGMTEFLCEIFHFMIWNLCFIISLQRILAV